MHKDDISQRFYRILFDMDPTLRPLFGATRSAQQKKFLDMLRGMVRGAAEDGDMVGEIQDMGRAHVDYGVAAHHYQTLGDALLKALKEGLGDTFCADTEEAWRSLYDLLSKLMINAGYKHHASAG